MPPLHPYSSLNFDEPLLLSPVLYHTFVSFVNRTLGIVMSIILFVNKVSYKQTNLYLKELNILKNNENSPIVCCFFACVCLQTCQESRVILISVLAQKGALVGSKRSPRNSNVCQSVCPHYALKLFKGLRASS